MAKKIEKFFVVSNGYYHSLEATAFDTEVEASEYVTELINEGHIANADEDVKVFRGVMFNVINERITLEEVK